MTNTNLKHRRVRHRSLEWAYFQAVIKGANGKRITMDHIKTSRDRFKKASKWLRETNMNAWDCSRQDAAYDSVDVLFREFCLTMDTYRMQNGCISKRMLSAFNISVDQ